MNITFLIGNGFDLNLGLDTRYSDFIKVYKSIETDNEILKKFKKDIDDDEKMWSDAEVAFGKYTNTFEKGKGGDFSICHVDFCKQLALYLTEQEKKFNLDSCAEMIKKAFCNLNKITYEFPTLERIVLDNIYKNRINEQITFNFISYNYTRTLDKCLGMIKKYPNILGTHKNGNNIYNHNIGKILHVHGTVTEGMIFGVNDETQISKPEIFECDDGDIYKNMFLKRTSNELLLENTDYTVANLVNESNIIYIYGMSIGATDKLWWERICKWLSLSDTRHVILQKYDTPIKEVVSTNYMIFERAEKNNFIQNINIDKTKKNMLAKRIHITGRNIFADICNIVKSKKLDENIVEDENSENIIENAV